MVVFSAKQLYEADAFTIKHQQISSTDLMERAGSQVFNWLSPQLESKETPILIVCGVGNNGGDGLVLARYLKENDFNVTVYIVNYTDKRSDDFLINYDRYKNCTDQWPIILKSENDFPEIPTEAIVVDAIFGIGLNRPPQGWVKTLIQYINQKPAFKIAIDIPSGLYADAPVEDFEAVLFANYTLTFTSPKLSFFLPETGVFVPNYQVLDIGLDVSFLNSLKPIAFLFSKNQAKEMIQPRATFSHKGDYGHALIIGGSYGKMGAAVLAAKSALKTGAGLVTVFAPSCGYSILQTALPEAMVVTDKNEAYISEIKPTFNPDAVGIGIGMGTDDKTIAAFKTYVKHLKKPLVLDADALNILSKSNEIIKQLPAQSILTPHPGELKRLIGTWKNDFDKLEKTQKFAKNNDVIVVVKGAFSITVTPDMYVINTSGNPGMATAGSGDVLTGILTGLLAQNYDPLEAALLGVYLHGMAGDIASYKMGEESLLASDIIQNMGHAHQEIKREPEENQAPQES